MLKEELFNKITEQLKKEYSVSGMSFAEQKDGCLSSSVEIGLNDGGNIKLFRIILTEIKALD